ncbi:MAG TPA: glycerate kinase [Solirubrobacteraceae bacterium]|nr:glycerate kinase [Solirubrobacteraceae bacterium]
MRVLVAPDSFKGTHSATAVADALARGFEHAGWYADRCPVADGGEGTMELLADALGGRLVAAGATDPLGRPVGCHFAICGDTAIVETAQASGLALVVDDERDPWAASTRGTGELILAAVAAGAREVVVAVGGSATTDGGRGAIDAIREGGGLGSARLAVLCDVECAFEDAPRVFGPQKGADREMVARLEQRLTALASWLPRDPRGVPATGAAGGLSGGLWAAFDAELRPGAAAVLDALRVDERLRASQLAIAGEGCIDEQSFGGKIVGELVRRARLAGVPIHAVVGTSRLSDDDRACAGLERVWTASTLEEIEEVGRALGAAAAGG